MKSGREHCLITSVQLTCSSYKCFEGNEIHGYRHNECCQFNLQHVSTGLTFNVVLRIIFQDPKMEVLGLNVDSNLDRNPHNKNSKHTSGG